MKTNETQYNDFLDLEEFYYNDNIDTIFLDSEKDIFFKKYIKDEGTEYGCPCIGIGSKEVKTFFLCINTGSEVGFVVFLKRIGFDVDKAIKREKNFKVLNTLYKINKVINLVN